MSIEAGDILSTTGKVVGRHRGYPFYTIGQRKGLGISMGKPVYVNKIEADVNRITVGSKDELLATGAVASNLNWIAMNKPAVGMNVETRIRYNDPGFPARIQRCENGYVEVHFQNSQSAVTPGQSIVFFNDNVVIGGGIIERAIK